MPDLVSKAEPTLLPLMHKLNPKDKAIICGVVRTNIAGYEHLHPGLLPFLPIRVACDALVLNASSRCQRIKAKLGVDSKWIPSTRIRNIYLSDAKVMNRFGVAPERGVVIPNAPKINRENVIQSPMMTLRHLKKGYWQVTVLRWYENHALTWLVDNCR